ncbi:MAG: ATP-binding protein, partial [Christensenella sp.]
MKEIKLQAKTENLPRITAFLEKLGVGEQYAVMVSAEEIFINIASYAYDKEGYVTLRAGTQDGVFVMEFIDEGEAYNPLTVTAPDVALSAKQRTPGGLGIYIVRQMMDAVEYERRGNFNVLRL